MKNTDEKLQAIDVLKTLVSVDESVIQICGYDKGIAINKIQQLELEVDLGVELRGYGTHYRVFGTMCTGVYLTKYTKEDHPTNVHLQDDEEWLVHFWFPCGSLSFNDSYGGDRMTSTYNNMIDELKGLLQPKYFDELNKGFYLESSKAKSVVEVLDKTFEKYKGLVQDEVKSKRKEALLYELTQLEKDV